MRRDHRPYFVKKWHLRLQRHYVNYFVRPQLEGLGKGFMFMKPWHVEIFGPSISLGNFATVIATPDKRVRLTVWADPEDGAGITIGDYALISPGARISASCGVEIGDNCMMASGVYITDSDWHGVYDRASSGAKKKVKIGDNTWIGDSAIVCKGVNIGENSILGAGSVATRDIPSNVIAAGNPAVVVRELDPEKKIIPRAQFFANPIQLVKDLDFFDRENLKGNSLSHWVRSLLFPRAGD